MVAVVFTLPTSMPNATMVWAMAGERPEIVHSHPINRVALVTLMR